MRIAVLAWETEDLCLTTSVGRHISSLCRSLAAEDTEVHLFCRSSEFNSPPISTDCATLYPIPTSEDSNFIDGIQVLCRNMVDSVLRVHRETPFDLIHAHDWVTSNAGVWLQEETGRPFFLTLHSIELFRNSGAQLSPEQHRIADHEQNGCNHADRILCVSHALKENIQTTYRVPPERVQVIYNGVDLSRFADLPDPGAVKSKYAVAPLEPLILFSGALEYRLGPDLLLEALPEVCNRHPEARCLLAGKGPMQRELEAIVDRLHLHREVRFTDEMDSSSQPALMAAADLVVLPSRNDPFSPVPLEAWAARTPIVTTKTGGPGEYVWHEVNGLLAEESSHSLAHEVTRLMEDWEWARWLGANGRTAAETAFQWSQAAVKTRSAYNAAISSASPE